MGNLLLFLEHTTAVWSRCSVDTVLARSESFSVGYITILTIFTLLRPQESCCFFTHFEHRISDTQN